MAVSCATDGCLVILSRYNGGKACSLHSPSGVLRRMFTEANQDWRRQAKCIDRGDLFFSDPGSREDNVRERQAKRLCALCPVRVSCLRASLEMETEGIDTGGDSNGKRGKAAAGFRPDGIWGGLTPAERGMTPRHYDIEQRIEVLEAKFKAQARSLAIIEKEEMSA